MVSEGEGFEPPDDLAAVVFEPFPFRPKTLS